MKFEVTPLLHLGSIGYTLAFCTLIFLSITLRSSHLIDLPSLLLAASCSTIDEPEMEVHNQNFRHDAQIISETRNVMIAVTADFLVKISLKHLALEMVSCHSAATCSKTFLT